VTATTKSAPAEAQDAFDASLNMPLRRRRLKSRDPQYMDLLDFLYDEAALLDQTRLEEWLELMAPDITYFMPIRGTRARKDGSEFTTEYGHFDDNLTSLIFRVKKLATPSSWGEDPQSRTRRFVTNVRAYTTDRDDEFFVSSDLLITRNRFTSTVTDIISAERRDIVRKIDEDTYKLVARRILADQSTIASANLAIFL
jgi:3-phenylpropionate/cinnamic acid dioxygenase small subunit